MEPLPLPSSLVGWTHSKLLQVREVGGECEDGDEGEKKGARMRMRMILTVKEIMKLGG